MSVESPAYKLLESIKLNDGEYDLLNDHIDRMKQSADYFNYRFSELKLRDQLQKYADMNKGTLQKVRVLLNEYGEIEVSGQAIKPLDSELTAILAETPISSGNPFLFHKTTNRDVYEGFQMNNPDFHDVLLWNEEGYITEFTNGNVVVKINGDLLRLLWNQAYLLELFVKS